jgi:hypothetical protein
MASVHRELHFRAVVPDRSAFLPIRSASHQQFKGALSLDSKIHFNFKTISFKSSEWILRSRSQTLRFDGMLFVPETLQFPGRADL